MRNGHRQCARRCSRGRANPAEAAFSPESRAAHNRPYAGGYVLDRHGATARGVHAMQVEICRATYLDAELREPGQGLAAVASVLAGLVRRIAEELAGERPLPMAAE